MDEVCGEWLKAGLACTAEALPVHEKEQRLALSALFAPGFSPGIYRLCSLW